MVSGHIIYVPLCGVNSGITWSNMDIKSVTLRVKWAVWCEIWLEIVERPASEYWRKLDWRSINHYSYSYDHYNDTYG